MDTKEKIHIAMVVGIWMAVIALILAIVVISKNIEEIKTDPIVIGMEKHNFVHCSCQDTTGRTITLGRVLDIVVG